ncbi:uncharacterized protein G2W53_012693 [Senna tora]|uniref:Uncharacterized protein n=1 Tax=Senna tora TaxID=362788 RepID=A0A834WNT2_9FABA|nr:uncharacterized protein G2W53_012693 [Senna tora]
MCLRKHLPSTKKVPKVLLGELLYEDPSP